MSGSCGLRQVFRKKMVDALNLELPYEGQQMLVRPVVENIRKSMNLGKIVKGVSFFDEALRIVNVVMRDGLGILTDPRAPNFIGDKKPEVSEHKRFQLSLASSRKRKVSPQLPQNISHDFNLF